MATKKIPLFFYLFNCALLSLLCITATAQTIFIPSDSLKSDEYIYHKIDDYKAFLDINTQKNANLLDTKLQKQYSKIIDEKNTDLLGDLKDKSFLFDTSVYPYLQAIFNHILEKNSLDKNQFHFFISRSAEVNAYTYEDGTVVCNLGLLSIIQNESQLAMVFSHEIGHYLLKHANTAIVKQLERLNSAELMAQIKEIQKGEYNTKEQLENLMIADVFNRKKHNRLQEAAADSMGMILFSKTDYNGSSIPHLFDLLDSTEKETSTCTIQDFFKQEDIKIDDSWFKPVKKMSFGAPVKQDIIDSLRTHPDCAKRKIVAEAYFDVHPKPGTDFLIGNPDQLSRIKNIAMFDEATHARNIGNLGFYLYQLIQNNTTFPANKYIKAEIFKTLLALCNHEKTHTLYEVASPPYIAESDKDEYDKLLKVLDKASLKELIQTTSDYYEKNKSLINASNESITNLNQLKTIQL